MARKNLPFGTVIKEPEKYFKVKDVFTKEAPKGSFRRLDEIKYLKLGKPIDEGHLIVQDHILIDDQGFAEAIPPGQVAFTLPMSAESFGDFLRPMHKMNVVLTAPKKEGMPVSKIIMESVLVLGEADELCRDQCGNLARLVTVAIFPEQVAQLAGALSQGKLHLTFSKLEDAPVGPGITIDHLLGRQE